MGRWLRFWQKNPPEALTPPPLSGQPVLSGYQALHLPAPGSNVERSTGREEFLHEYAKLISGAAFGSLQGGFITDRFMKLRDGQLRMSGSIREWEWEQELPKQCFFFGAAEGLTTDHLIAKKRGGEDTADNLVLACACSNSSRGDRGSFGWLGLIRKEDLHRLVAGIYLKELFRLHAQSGTLAVFGQELEGLCDRCPLPGVCGEADSAGVLARFCLESVLPRNERHR